MTPSIFYGYFILLFKDILILKNSLQGVGITITKVSNVKKEKKKKTLLAKLNIPFWGFYEIHIKL